MEDDNENKDVLLESLSPKETEDFQADSGTSDIIKALQASVLQTESNFSGLHQVLNASLRQTMQMSQTMSQIMEQFLLKGLSIKVEVQPIKDGFEALLYFYNEGVLPILGLTYEMQTTSKALSPQATLMKSSSSNPTETCNKKASHITLCNISPGSAYHETWKFKCHGLEPLGFNVDVTFPSPGTGEILSKSQTFDVGVLDQIEREMIESSREDLGMLETVDLDLNFIRYFFNITPHQGILPGQSWLSLSKKDTLLVMLTPDPEHSSSCQTIWKMKVYFSFDKNVSDPNFLTNQILQELCVFSRRFSAKRNLPLAHPLN